MFRRIQHSLIALTLATAFSCGICSIASAQQPAQQQPAQQPPQQGPASNVQLTRSYTFDGILFVLLVGGALYAVCRSSQRR